MKYVLTILLSTSIMLGCTTPNDTPAGSNKIVPSTEAAFDKNLKARYGKKIDSVIAEWGTPLSVEKNSIPGNRLYKFQINPKVLHFEDEDITIWCEVGFNVTPDGRIKSAGHFGHCRAPDFSPNAYGGPLAQLLTTEGTVEDAHHTLWFRLAEIYDAPKLPSQCEGESFSKGSGIPARCIGEEIPAQPMRAKLVAYREADLLNGSKKTSTLVEGTVKFSPTPDKSYKIAGESKYGQTSVWIEDRDTHQPVTEKVVSTRQ